MSELHNPTVAALIEACTAALGKSEFVSRNDWPDVGRTTREMMRERAMVVLGATGIPLHTLAEMAEAQAGHRDAGQVAAVLSEPAAEAPKPVREIPTVEVRRWGWWRR